MSGNRSWKKACRSYNEVASDLVRKCVATLRRSGVRTTGKALVELADELQVSHRRARSLFYQDGTPSITDSEWTAMRRHACIFFLNMEEKHLRLAEKCKAEHQSCEIEAGLRDVIASGRR